AVPLSASVPDAAVSRPWHSYANQPLREQMQRQLLPLLRSYLGERLPAYMVPSALLLLDALPLTVNGKLDRAALPLPERRVADATFVAPRTPLEAEVAQIWAAVLGQERIGVEDNFFALGGHSLLATQLIARVRQQFQCELPLQAVFDAPTVARLAVRIAQAQPSAALPLVAAARPEPLPLSVAQQRLWFLDQLQPDNPFYTIPMAVRLTGALNVDALEQSLSAVVARHETLRTTFVPIADQPSQRIAPPTPMPLPLIDLRTLREDRREQEALRLAAKESSQPFDLTQGPLIRATLIRLHDDDHILLLTLHHIISDGWSQGVLIGELAQLYTAFVAGDPSPLAALPIQYADYALWQRQWLTGAVLEQQLRYWKAQLADLPTLALPTDRPRPAVQSFRGADQIFAVPPELTAGLQALSQAAGVTLFMTTLALFQVLLSRHSGQDDIVVGTPIAGRTRAELDNLIGFFVNTLVLRTDLGGQPTFAGLLERTRATALEAYAHQDLPFEQLVEVVQPQRDLSRQPLFQVMFALQNAPL
ncbi:MAG TPA: condensation domain-containing protein, partial [Herpetosiphonaceae bacterium]